MLRMLSKNRNLNPVLQSQMTESTKKVRATAAQVRAARELLGINQTQLATAAMVNLKTLSAFESGSHPVYDSTADKIQEALERRGIIFGNGGRPSVTLDQSKAIVPI